MDPDDAIARLAFEKAGTVMVLLDADGTIQRINDRGCAVLGYGREQLVGENWFETVVPTDSDVGLADVLAAVREGGGFDVHENTIETDDGDIRCIKWHVSGIRDDGTITGLLVSGSDVTERIETERRLRRYEQVVESSTNYLAAVDCDYEYLLANRAYREYHGIGDSIESGLTIPDVLGEDHFASIKPQVDRALSGESLEFETERRGPDGDERVFHVRYFPLIAADDSVQGAVTAMRDITERKARERVRRETRETFEGLFEAINDAAFVHDLDGEILAVNETAIDRLGYDREEVVGMTVADLDTAEYEERIEERMATIESKGELTFESTHVTADGEEIPVEVTASQVNYFGQQAILSLARDVSDRKEHERQLEREVERLDEFASVISHDLRNPLNVAQGRLTLAVEDCESEHLDPLADALDRMESIIADTLTLARQGEIVGETEAIAIESILYNCWDAVETGDGTLELEEAFTLRADRDRLQHVFENLFRNAVEHAGRDVTVRVGRAGDAAFYVEDDGPGIPEDDRTDVFEAGFTTREQGTGFGLTIVQQIADAHGWTVRATESDAGGARFVFEGVERDT